ncbi:DNA adenine methylase [uncultured Tyzzerella sp.]|uniref:DNA adenine methylase n=1 Tax=uncultured Tyzzerella sp. TaxID=2321398 RepID=UPI00294242D4|nr:DNA adenine methylase [uncultured Tyzzerella sp.]
MINNRRYLGNKYKLLPFITKVINEECGKIESVADIFAGTGAVASAFTNKTIITNDLMYSNFICNLAWFSPQSYDPKLIIDYIVYYNAISNFDDNYMTKKFADTYFSYNDCSKIGFIREDIERNYKLKKINERERAILLTSLLYAMDKIAKTCGHYDAYRKGVEFTSTIELSVLLAKIENRLENKCFNKDANELVRDISVDLVYIDPPYNSRQYCDAYHLLENVARWEKPEVYGVARKMNRDNIKSKYCTKDATNVFEDLIKNIKSKYIVFSYNNMSNKGNDRSNAKISDEDIMRILKNKGDVKIFSESYKAFSAGKSNIQNNAERLFLCTCFSEVK